LAINFSISLGDALRKEKNDGRGFFKKAGEQVSYAPV
jgi:hypothetical protein